MFCGYSRHADTSGGDSGGPAVINGKLAGITSYGFPRAPGVYTDVHRYKEWIEKKIGSNVSTENNSENKEEKCWIQVDCSMTESFETITSNWNGRFKPMLD